MAPYALIMLENGWILLSVPENAWIDYFEYDNARVLNLPRHGYNNIIIIATNVIILEILSARFENRGTLLSLF